MNFKFNMILSAEYLPIALFFPNQTNKYSHFYQSLYSFALLFWFLTILLSHFISANWNFGYTLQDSLHMPPTLLSTTILWFREHGSPLKQPNWDTRQLQDEGCLCHNSFAFILHQVVSTKYQLGHLFLIFNYLK